MENVEIVIDGHGERLSFGSLASSRSLGNTLNDRDAD